MHQTKAAQQLPYILGAMTIAVFVAAVCVPTVSHTQPLVRIPPAKSLSLDSITKNDAIYDFSLGTSLGDIIGTSSDTSLYDPLTLRSLRRLKEQSFPYWSGDELEPDRTRRVVEKAFALESVRNMSLLIQDSELREVYRELRQGLQTVKDYFRYSLQSDGSQLLVSRAQKGRKLVELRVEFSARKGIEPQIAFGENVRFKYDYVYSRPMVELGFDF